MNRKKNSTKKLKYSLFCSTIICAYFYPPFLALASELPVRDYIQNPAAKYCSDLGYQYQVKNTDQGEVGFCVFPNGQKVDGWNFAQGKAGQDFNYCKKMGYESELVTNDSLCQSIYSKDCIICKLPNGFKYEATMLMKIDSQSEKCGDIFCTKSENVNNCPEDCSAGGKDNYCDQKYKDTDLDCIAIKSTTTSETIKSSKTFLFGMLAIIFLSIIGLGFYFIKFRKNPEI